MYSKVCEAKINNGSFKDHVAVKIIDKEAIKDKLKEETFKNEVTDEDFLPYIKLFNKEIKNTQLCWCENSVKIYDYYNKEKEFIIIMELCDCNLIEVLAKSKNGLSVEEIKDILLQLNNAFKKMRLYKISHRDIKPQNILVKYLNKEKTKYKVLLSDYGISN